MAVFVVVAVVVMEALNVFSYKANIFKVNMQNIPFYSVVF